MRKAFGLSAVLLGAMLGSAGPALPATTYDGAWNVVVVCSDFGDVKGYTWRFPARVRGGEISGKFVNPEDPSNFGVLSGAIAASGDALLTMDGATGKVDYAFQHVASYSKFHYTASVHFDAASGAGNRREQRPCSLSFSKT